jgi:hypothetical protein
MKAGRITGPWHDEAIDLLLRLECPSGGWAEHPSRPIRAEATALAGLALLSWVSCEGEDRALATARRAARALAGLQRTDGSIAVSRGWDGPGWATPLAVWLWTALDQQEAERRRAVDWLLGSRGVAFSGDSAEARVLGHDTTLVGWSWTEGAHSWVEPTAFAVLALRLAGQAAHPRVEEGVRLIADRVLARGGWNFGNTTAFGRPLRPHPMPTGLALLALGGARETTSRGVAESLDWLESALATTRASASLAWGLLGLRAWGRRPAGSASWTSESFRNCENRPTARRMAFLLLADGPRSLGLMGVEPIVKHESRANS